MFQFHLRFAQMPVLHFELDLVDLEIMHEPLEFFVRARLRVGPRLVNSRFAAKGLELLPKLLVAILVVHPRSMLNLHDRLSDYTLFRRLVVSISVGVTESWLIGYSGQSPVCRD